MTPEEQRLLHRTTLALALSAIPVALAVGKAHLIPSLERVADAAARAALAAGVLASVQFRKERL